ncbi:MAG: DUF366 family protein [Heliobacteriaceae bacterium]|nr:DUF366 family protein [Heliobacteriaceae bacterium]MDD4586795.1 DUF366 family protein [Heliobacteriaceae bacterium]
MLKTFFGEEPQSYDGTQLSSLWAYRRYKIMGDSIVAFRGSCRVALDKMVDLEDVLAGDFIYSPEMLHFIVEQFDQDLEKAVLRQRLLIVMIKEELAARVNRVLIRCGDDLYWEGKKLSVSIATLSPVSAMIHVGLNLCTEGTPVPTVSLAQLGENDPQGFGCRIMDRYVAEIADIHLARCKVRGVG